MMISELRKKLGLSQEEFAKAVGLTSKSYVSELESAQKPRCSVKVALEIERISDGVICAATLNPDVALIRDVDRRDAAA